MAKKWNEIHRESIRIDSKGYSITVVSRVVSRVVELGVTEMEEE
jgi:hypothetical protein